MFRTTLHKTVLFLLLFYCYSSFAQNSHVNETGSHTYYVKLLGRAKDSLYTSSLALYDAYIRQHPADYTAQIERCKFIEQAYYDESEEYNPKYDEWSSALDNLFAAFPHEPDVLLYKSESEYGDSALVFCKRVLREYDYHPEAWEGKNIWLIYNKLAETYDNKEKPEEALKYGLLAMQHNDTLDNSVLLANQYKALKQKDKAVAILLKHLDATKQAWTLNQKGKLLLELGKPAKALQAFNLAKRDSNSWVDNKELSKALAENGFYKEARSSLLKNLENAYNKKDALKQLFNFDLQYGDADSALASYRKMVDGNFMADPVGLKRLQLFLKAPAHLLSFADMLRIALIALAAVLVVILPYVLILPIYQAGHYFKKNGMVLAPSPFRWGLRHFWIICSMFIFVDLLSEVAFNYNTLFEDDGAEEKGLVSLRSANIALFAFAGYLITTLLVTRRRDLGLFWGSVWSKRESVLKGIGSILLLRTLTGIYVGILRLFSGTESKPLAFLSINDHVTSINQYYHPLLGLLFVAFIVPIYEEFLFRGVILSATEKHMRFFLANGLQALLFGLVHLDLKLLPFYIAFGLLAGYYRQKSQSLAPGIVMHITNNLISFIAILAMSR